MWGVAPPWSGVGRVSVGCRSGAGRVPVGCRSGWRGSGRDAGRVPVGTGLGTGRGSGRHMVTSDDQDDEARTTTTTTGRASLSRDVDTVACITKSDPSRATLLSGRVAPSLGGLTMTYATRARYTGPTTDDIGHGQLTIVRSWWGDLDGPDVDADMMPVRVVLTWRTAPGNIRHFATVAWSDVVVLS